MNKLHTKHRFHHSTVKAMSDRNQRIYDFLTDNPVGVLCTVTPDSVPHGSVIYFLTDDDFNITFLTKAETRKHDNLMHNNKIMLTIFEPHSQAVAQVTGVAEEIEGSYDVNEVAGGILAASLKSSGPGMPPIVKLMAGPYTAFRITPKLIRMAIYSRPDPGEYEDLFESIESFELEKTEV